MSLKRHTELRRKTRLRPRSLRPKKRAAEEQAPKAVEFASFVRSLPCAGCGESGVDAHHSGHDHGLGQKASWMTLIPLERSCHDALHDAKGIFADQERRRQWELRVQADVWAAFDDYKSHRQSIGTVDAQMEFALRASASVAWLKGRDL